MKKPRNREAPGKQLGVSICPQFEPTSNMLLPVGEEIKRRRRASLEGVRKTTRVLGLMTP